jgi:SAM-dependent methyltransferase
MTDIDFSGNIERFSGFADLYDRHRPAPPDILAAILLQYSGSPYPEQVVDLGSGTGLSTRYWADKAREVIGIEPSADMRRKAEAQTTAANVEYREGLSHQTGLPNRCADIVSCSQSLHWMEPQATFSEARRILRPGGVFAANDVDWPPVVANWEVEAAYNECMRLVREFEKGLSLKAPVHQWSKEGHLARMQASGCFRFTREIVVHQVDRGNAERLVGLLISQGNTMTVLKNGISETQVGIDRFREAAERVIGQAERPWYWSCRLRIGIV